MPSITVANVQAMDQSPYIAPSIIENMIVDLKRTGRLEGHYGAPAEHMDALDAMARALYAKYGKQVSQSALIAAAERFDTSPRVPHHVFVALTAALSAGKEAQLGAAAQAMDAIHAMVVALWALAPK